MAVLAWSPSSTHFVDFRKFCKHKHILGNHPVGNFNQECAHVGWACTLPCALSCRHLIYCSICYHCLPASLLPLVIKCGCRLYLSSRMVGWPLKSLLLTSLEKNTEYITLYYSIEGWTELLCCSKGNNSTNLENISIFSYKNSNMRPIITGICTNRRSRHTHADTMRCKQG